MLSSRRNRSTATAASASSSSAYVVLRWTTIVVVIMSACRSPRALTMLHPLRRQSRAWKAAHRPSPFSTLQIVPANQRLQEPGFCNRDWLGAGVAAGGSFSRPTPDVPMRRWMSTSSSSEGPAATQAADEAEAEGLNEKDDEEKAAVQAAREARKYVSCGLASPEWRNPAVRSPTD
jgi:hypothetical protein